MEAKAHHGLHGEVIRPLTPAQAAAMKRCQSLTYVHVPRKDKS